MKKQKNNINIRVDDLTIAYLNYLCNRYMFKVTKSEIIRKLIENEYQLVIEVDKRQE